MSLLVGMQLQLHIMPAHRFSISTLLATFPAKTVAPERTFRSATGRPKQEI
jgi:hypothetical protein